MDTSRLTFVRGPKEHSGAVDLVNHYKLWPHHEFFCKKSPSASVLDTNYLRNVVGDTHIRKGEGMQLDQLVRNVPSRHQIARIRPFSLDTLGEAFHFRESSSISLNPSDKGIPTVAVRFQSEAKGTNEKHEEKDGAKGKERKKHKIRRGEKDKERTRSKSDKRKKGDADQDIVKAHKKSKV